MSACVRACDVEFVMTRAGVKFAADRGPLSKSNHAQATQQNKLFIRFYNSQHNDERRKTTTNAHCWAGEAENRDADTDGSVGRV